MRRVLVTLACAACTAASPVTEPPPPVAVGLLPAIVHGEPSGDAQNAVVLVMHYDALAEGGGAASGCTGTLLTPRLVLTARHCVAETDAGAACNARGEATAGGAVIRDHAPGAIYVFAGKERPDFLGGTARPSRGQEILSTGAKTICNGDLALVLLERALEGAAIAPVRLDAPPVRGEPVTLVGWGVTENEPNPAGRLQRGGVPIDVVGPARALGPAEFQIGEATCHGDSGGPALAASGAVLGALSRGGNGGDDSGAGGCIDAENVFTSVASYADFIRAGYAKAGQEPWLEGEPNPLLARRGDACASDGECQSGLCDAEKKACAAACAAAACPGGERCAGPESRRLCVPDPTDEGCSSAGPARSGAPAPFLCVLAVIFVLARRKK